MKPLQATMPRAVASEPVAVPAVPVLETKRLLLRPFRAGDLDDLARINADPAFVRHLAHAPLSRADSWRQLAVFVGHWQLNGFGFFAAEERASGRFLGRIGCWQPEGWPGFEIGWGLDPGVWGRGLATEGGRAALAFARDLRGRREIISVIHPRNAASIRVAEKLGGTFARRDRVSGVEVVIYAYPTPDGGAAAA